MYLFIMFHEDKQSWTTSSHPFFHWHLYFSWMHSIYSLFLCFHQSIIGESLFLFLFLYPFGKDIPFVPRLLLVISFACVSWPISTMQSTRIDCFLSYGVMAKQWVHIFHFLFPFFFFLLGWVEYFLVHCLVTNIPNLKLKLAICNDKQLVLEWELINSSYLGS